MIKFFLLSGLSLIFFCLDRASKLWAEKILSQQDLLLWGDFFRFHLTHNTNLALSIPFPLWAQITLSLILLGILIWYFAQKHIWNNRWEQIFIALIFGGALGNLVDRILFQQVVDFIAVWKFPVFNLADTFLFVGVVFFLLQELYREKKNKKIHKLCT